MTIGEPTAWWSRIEDAGLNASAPPQQRWIDGWLVRFSPGKAQRARCINAVSDGRLTLAQRLDVCQAIYAEHQLPMTVRITPFSQPSGLDSELQALGFITHDDTRVMVRSSLLSLDGNSLPTSLDIATISLKAYAHIVGELRGTSSSAIEAHAQRLEHSPVRYRSFVVRDGEQHVIACAQTAIENALVGLYDVFTVPAWRGQGLSRQLCARLLQLAANQGAQAAYLQVDAGNTAARAVYGRLGFSDAYGYHYRTPPSATGPAWAANASALKDR